jgi:hypothetical protein
MFENFIENMFGKKKMPEVPELPDIPKPEPVKAERNNEDYYRIGTTSDGLTTLTVRGAGSVTLTLTMYASSVRQMIRLLEATLPEDDDERKN